MVDVIRDNPLQAPLIRLENLHVRFGHQIVLRGVDLQVPRGQTLAIIGESGCGKTVLLKAMIGLIRPTQGQVRFDDQDLAALNDRELSQQRLRYGFVFQNAALFDSMTVGQNVAFPLRQQGVTQQEDIERAVLARLAEVGLPDSVVSKKPAELSGGMRKRVGIARASVVNPELMLYDEPTTGLDPIMGDVINELMMRARRRYSVTSVIVTHDMRTARKVADRVVMVFPVTRLESTEPQIIFDGPPSELDRTKDRRVRQFVQGEAGERLMEMRQAVAAAGGSAHAE
jgi:phospholipid/cholesterol/gamma-HCH transport system ATP-binding protein